jgi:hypothetical protein
MEIDELIAMAQRTKDEDGLLALAREFRRVGIELIEELHEAGVDLGSDSAVIKGVERFSSRQELRRGAVVCLGEEEGHVSLASATSSYLPDGLAAGIVVSQEPELNNEKLRTTYVQTARGLTRVVLPGRRNDVGTRLDVTPGNLGCIVFLGEGCGVLSAPTGPVAVSTILGFLVGLPSDDDLASILFTPQLLHRGQAVYGTRGGE